MRAWSGTAAVILALTGGPGDGYVRAIDVANGATRRPPLSRARFSGITPGDWSAIQKAVESSSYRVWPVTFGGYEQAYQASNEEQQYATDFRASGIEIRSKSVPALGREWELSLAVTRYGYPDDLLELPAAQPRGDKERVAYQRGPVLEWYLNRPEGLEQGFELRQPARFRSAPIVVEMALGGGLRARSAATGVAFVDESGRTVIRYGEVKAWDADGKTLSARLDPEDGKVRLVVEAQGARFPLTVDPTFVHEARLASRTDPIGRANTWLGASVAVAGDTAVVGAPGSIAGHGHLGSVYVFVRSSGTWTLHQKLLNPNADVNNQENFGWSVSLSENTIVVGSPHDSSNLPWAGSAYVFVRSGVVWTPQQRLRAPDAAAGDRFGYSVSVSGSTTVVGADQGLFAQGGPGSAYAFVRSGVTWSLQQKLVAGDPVPGTWVGNSVSLIGDTVILGAPRALNASGVETGAAYVFVRSGSSWSQQQKLFAADGMGTALFGASTSLSGETALIGAPFHDSMAGDDVGAAYTFVRVGAVWTQEQKLVASDGATRDYFGRHVAIAGDRAVVGADGDDDVATDTGSAYVFTRAVSTWTQSQRLVAADGAFRDLLGSSVAASGETILVGAIGVDAGGAVDSGSVYSFRLTGATWQPHQTLVAGDEIAGDQLGFSLSLSGDTLAVGALQDDTAVGVDSGSAYVFVRTGGTWREQQKLVSPEPVGSFGYSVAASGDTVVVGAPNHSNFLGAVYVFVRSAGTWSLQQKIGGAVQYAMFGRSLALSGNTLVVGTYSDNLVSGDPGGAHVFVRSAGTWTHQQALLASDRAPNDAFGAAVSVEGETAVVGAPRADLGPGEDAGAAYVFIRSGASWTQERKLTAGDEVRYDQFGFGVSIAGDTILVGAPFSLAARGAAYVFVRTGMTWAEQKKLIVTDAWPLAQLGYSVSISGDTALIGAVADAGKGAAYLFGRSGTTWSQRQRLLPPPDGDAFGVFGFSVSMSGDTAAVGDFRHSGVAGTDGGSVDIFAEGSADLSVSKTDGMAEVAAGRSLAYEIVVSNAGPHPATGARVQDPLPSAVTCATSCSGTGGARCGLGTLEPTIDDRIDIPAGQSVTYTSTCVVSATARGTILNTVTVSAPAELTDPDPSNNVATDADSVLAAVSIGDATATREAGEAVFDVVLSEPHVSQVTVEFVSRDGTGKAGIDYTAVSGTLTFAAGQTSARVSVPLLPGGSTGTKSFLVELANAVNTLIGDGSGRGLIVDPGSLGFRPLTPCRVVDTRDSGLGGPIPLAAGEIATFAIIGRCNVPSSAKSVSVNVTVTAATAAGHVRVYPAGSPLPLVSAINYSPAQTRANSAVVVLGVGGDLGVYVGQPAGSVHLIIDVNGYFE